MIAVDVSMQQALDADPKAIQQINFTANLEQETQESVSFLKKRKKLLGLERILGFSQETVKVL